MLLNAKQILDADDAGTTDVEVEEWGGTVRLRSLNARERGLYMNLVQQAKRPDGSYDWKSIESTVVGWSLIGDDGNRLFEDSEIEALQAKSGSVIHRLFEEAQALSGLTEDDIEEMEGN